MTLRRNYMKLNEFIQQLVKLQFEGHGGKQVMYRHSASGDCSKLGSAHITDRVDEYGPFDLKDGEEYISIYAGD
jgi:hypothetical protein